MIRTVVTTTSLGAACMLAAFALFSAPTPLSAVDAIDSGRFVWHDLMTKDVEARQAVLRWASGLAVRKHEAR
jgi:hypothetical protein